MEVENKYQIKYMEDPDACPVCGSYDLEADEPLFETWDMYRTVMCHKCKSEWEELFTLTGIAIIEPENVEIQEQQKSDDEIQIRTGNNGS